MNLKSFIGSVALVTGSLFFHQANAGCKLTYDAAKTSVQWTAFKTNKKVPVKGKFTTFEVKGTKVDESLANVFKDVNFSIDSSKIDTTNPQRDNTISKNFFQKWKKDGKITGAVSQFKEESPTAGSFDLVLTLNEVTNTVPMTYTMDENGKLMAKGVLNIFDFNGVDSLKSLNKACKALHAPGSTWADMEVELVSEFTKDCSK